jgi:hypothetical protein
MRQKKRIRAGDLRATRSQITTLLASRMLSQQQEP